MPFFFEKNIIEKEANKMDARKVVIEVLSKRCDVSSINENDNLKSLGLDSLDLVEAMLEIEDELGINFKNEEIEQCKTLGDILNIIDEKLSKK